MMSVLEYAEDVNKTINEILNLCKRLGIPANSEDDMLDEDAIVELHVMRKWKNMKKF